MALSENQGADSAPPGETRTLLARKEKKIIGIEALTASLPASFPSEDRVLFRAVARTVGRSSDL